MRKRTQDQCTISSEAQTKVSPNHAVGFGSLHVALPFQWDTDFVGTTDKGPREDFNPETLAQGSSEPDSVPRLRNFADGFSSNGSPESGDRVEDSDGQQSICCDLVDLNLR